MVDVWAQAALIRTVASLPALHPWRLGDVKGSSRLLQWTARPSDGADTDDEHTPVALLSVTARDPGLDRGDGGAGTGIDPFDVVDLAATAIGGLTGLARDAVRAAGTPASSVWAGAMVRLPGTSLPDAVWLPRQLRGLDDPGTAWPTESVELRQRFTLHAADVEVLAALLTPAVMAIALDEVPSGSAVTVAGDAVHVWWPHEGDARRQVGRVARATRAVRRLADSFPRFVLADHPDRSAEVEGRLAQRQAAAAAYRAARDAQLRARYLSARSGGSPSGTT